MDNIDQTQSVRDDHAQHRSDDGAEHDLEDRHVMKVELSGQFGRAPESSSFQHEPETEADRYGHHQPKLAIQTRQRLKRKYHVHCLLMV